MLELERAPRSTTLTTGGPDPPPRPATTHCQCIHVPSACARACSLCYNGTETLPTGAKAFPWASFRFGVGVGGLGPSEGDGSGRYLCVPNPDALVAAWAEPLKAAGIELMPIISGGASLWPVAGRDEGFFEAAV